MTSSGINRNGQIDFDGGPAIIYNERLLASFGIEIAQGTQNNRVLKNLKFFKVINKSR